MGLFSGVPFDNSISQLERRLNVRLEALTRAQESTARIRNELTTALASYASPDTALIALGSIAREEVTSASDLDWMLLLDGQATPQHKAQELAIKEEVNNYLKSPGQSGVFGRL